MQKFPSLNALYVFAAVARHKSFQQAAEELDVTPTAVSHQIKVLEGDLGVLLFRRRPRPLALTEAGQQLYPVVQGNLDSLAEEIARLRNNPVSMNLTVSVINVFAAKWLVARLPDFQSTYPEIDIYLQTSKNVVDLQARTIDLAIRYGSGNYPGLEVCKLMSDVFTPVCSPRFLEGNHPLQTPHNLAAHSLIHFEWINYSPVAPNWKSWLEMAGLNTIDSNRGLKFNEESLAIQAAIAGQGVALCSSIHVADDEALNFLIKPFSLALPGFTYSAVYLKNHPKKEFILKFVTWLIEQIRTFSAI